MHKLDNDLIKALDEYMFVEDVNIKANATLVLGNTLWQRPLQKAIELYQKGLSGTVIFCGGFNHRLGYREAEAMQQQWSKLGFPESATLYEVASTNTYENMVNAKILLSNTGLLVPDMVLNVVSISYHMRRSIETFDNVFGRKVRFGVANYSSQFCARSDWFQNPQGTKLLLNEALKIKAYLPNSSMPNALKKLLDGFELN